MRSAFSAFFCSRLAAFSWDFSIRADSFCRFLNVVCALAKVPFRDRLAPSVNVRRPKGCGESRTELAQPQSIMRGFAGRQNRKGVEEADG